MADAMDDLILSHHYVPQWYQRRFLPGGKGELWVRDLNPAKFIDCADGVRRPIPKPRELFRSGPDKLFEIENLYAISQQGLSSDALERSLFGGIDSEGAIATQMFDLWPKTSGFGGARGAYPDASFGHPSERMQELVMYLNAQKFRTPKGMDQVKNWLVGRAERIRPTTR
jgi:hypothetical protein